MSKLVEHIRKEVSMNSATELAITKKAEIQNLAKGTILLKENNICSMVYRIGNHSPIHDH